MGFHSLAEPRGALLSTEQALRRLYVLGFTKEDEPIRRTLDTLSACLRGERKIDASWEKGIDWAMFEPLMLAAWVRRFDPENPEALALGRRWARVAEAAFASGTLDASAWNAAYEQEFHRKERHPHPLGLWAFYHGMLLPGLLTEPAERALLHHLLTRPDGMYYIDPKPLMPPPAECSGRDTSRWLAALEVLSAWPTAPEALAFAAAWLRLSRRPDGTWDLGAGANDKVYLPLSDSWRREEARRADCTLRIERLLDRLEKRE